MCCDCVYHSGRCHLYEEKTIIKYFFTLPKHGYSAVLVTDMDENESHLHTIEVVFYVRISTVQSIFFPDNSLKVHKMNKKSVTSLFLDVLSCYP